MLAFLLAAIASLSAANPHVSMQTAIEPATVMANSDVTMTFQVTPARGIHVYAPGAKDYQIVSVTLDPQPGVKARPTIYPPSEMYEFEPLDESVPVYSNPFTLKQVVVVTRSALKGKDALTLTGRLEYQACDDRVCYKPGAIPFTFELKVKR